MRSPTVLEAGRPLRGAGARGRGRGGDPARRQAPRDGHRRHSARGQRDGARARGGRGGRGVGRQGAGERRGPRRKVPGPERRPAQRHAGPRPRLRRHPPALRAAPERRRGPRRARGGRGRGGFGQGAPRRRGRRRRAGRRVGMAGYDPELGNSVFFEKGLHATSICGTLGAALAAAMLYGLDEEAIGNAVAISASMGAGIIEANRTGGTVKRDPLRLGRPLGGRRRGARRARPDRSADGLRGKVRLPAGLPRRGRRPRRHNRRPGRKHWELAQDLLQALPGEPLHPRRHRRRDRAARRGPRTWTTIEALELGVAAPVLRTIAQPRGGEGQAADTGYAAQFSGPFTVATALVGGGGLGVSLDDFTDDDVEGRGEATPGLPRHLPRRRGVQRRLSQPVSGRATGTPERGRGEGGARHAQPRRSREPALGRGARGQVPGQRRACSARKSERGSWERRSAPWSGFGGWGR